MEEKMLSKLLVSTVAVIGLLLMGPQKASADVIYACVNSTTGLVYIVSATTNCPPPTSGATWTKISWNATSSSTQPGTNLLFTYVTNVSGFDTGFTISNTSADPFNTATQTGTCTLSIYSTGVVPITLVTPAIPPGTSYVNLLSVIAPGTNGYMFASCTFTYAHGFAFISDVGARNLAMGYLALIVQTPRLNGENLNN
jgi:hypothetical protein